MDIIVPSLNHSIKWISEHPYIFSTVILFSLIDILFYISSICRFYIKYFLFDIILLNCAVFFCTIFIPYPKKPNNLWYAGVLLEMITCYKYLLIAMFTIMRHFKVVNRI